MVLAEWLPGVFDNGEQVAFDVRLKVAPEARHAPLQWRITRIKDSALGPYVFEAERVAGAVTQRWIWTLTADAGFRTVRMRQHKVEQFPADPAQLKPIIGCDILWTRGAGQFTARSEPACMGEDAQRQTIALELSAAKLTELRQLFDRKGKLAAGNPENEPDRLNRARLFECYVDIPGVGGGAAIPFKRTSGLKVHDQGGEAWFTTQETPSRKLGLRLRSVDWPMNNAPGTFTRNSLTLYVLEDQGGAEPKTISYGWTEPGVRRIGLNLKQLLANCFLDSPAAAKPEF
jgi:hypothetical protein